MAEATAFLFLYAPRLAAPIVTAAASSGVAAAAASEAANIVALPLSEVQLTKGLDSGLFAVTAAVTGAAAAAPQVGVPAALSVVASLGGVAGILCAVPLVGLVGRRAFGMMQREKGVTVQLGGSGQRSGALVMSASPEEPVLRREFLSKMLGASALVVASAAKAEIDYAGVGYLGGSSNIDVNNANVRVYCKLPGMYPGAAGKIVSNAPYKSKEDMYSKAKLTAKEAEATKKYDSRFLFLEPRPEYIIDNINNGLYR
jgi:photosystem II PsbU protein